MSIVKTVGKSLNVLSYVSSAYASKIALDLFASPRKGRVTETDLQFLNTASKHELKYGDFKIMTYNWSGKGKTILLAHGWESNSARWQFLITTLQDLNYNIVALDAPAHGDSGSQQFNAVLYSEFINVVAKHYNPEIIIGHSVGGMAAVFFQHKYKFKGLKQLVTLGSPAHFEGVFQRYVDLLGYNQKIKKGLDNLVYKRFGQWPSYFSAAKFSEDISAQALIVHDTKDNIIPFEDALLYQKHFKNAELFETTGFGHGLKSETVTRVQVC